MIHISSNSIGTVLGQPPYFIDIYISSLLNISMPRIARVVATNYPHHVTQRGTNRTNIFCDDEDRIYFLKYLNECAIKTETKIWAYCLMDNHFHLLLDTLRDQGLGKCLHGATFRYAQYFKKIIGPADSGRTDISHALWRKMNICGQLSDT